VNHCPKKGQMASFCVYVSVAELSNGTIVMLMRKDGTVWLYRCDSKDGGKSWSNYYQTNIPNPSNKPRLFNLDNGRIALINTASNGDNTKGNTWGRHRWNFGFLMMI